jgi:hypothetical protein
MNAKKPAIPLGLSGHFNDTKVSCFTAALFIRHYLLLHLFNDNIRANSS